MTEACALSSLVSRISSEKQWKFQTPHQRHKGPFKSVAKQPVLPSEKINFRFRTRLIYATATKASFDFPNVLHLQICPSIIDRMIDRLLDLLLTSWRDRVGRYFPEWNLPPCLILKMCKKNWDKEFEVEKSTYKALEIIQGTRIPNFYGELKYNGKKAILISDIGGVCLGDPAGAVLEIPDFLDLMKEALTDLGRFHIQPDDIKLNNFRLVNGRIMVIDFEMVLDKFDTNEDCAREILGLTYWLGRQYEGRQSCHLADGLITQVK
ncbi:uncharacterized protein UV8b_07659 [Ustilaginoidea virens]|uniref:Protein kinase domain-containing protein n=1 Tax=Ustilaginoidea virens TaxID=1159556 RepID=A0A8E5MK96_USTVR|nr:uncharacterized protein UV8b_07659 [Ustilaginoidea virens]QUC23418.1 hypothetical protein UV8b_07659 [Ustilaginoidea virens]